MCSKCANTLGKMITIFLFDVKISDYPSISFEEDQQKAEKSLAIMSEESRKDTDEFFNSI